MVKNNNTTELVLVSAFLIGSMILGVQFLASLNNSLVLALGGF